MNRAISTPIHPIPHTMCSTMLALRSRGERRQPARGLAMTCRLLLLPSQGSAQPLRALLVLLGVDLAPRVPLRQDAPRPFPAGRSSPGTPSEDEPPHREGDQDDPQRRDQRPPDPPPLVVAAVPRP